MKTLRGYQTDMVTGAREALRYHRRVLIQSPTGSGKTAIASHMIHGVVGAGWDTWFLCHRDELVQQTSKTLIQAGVDHSFVAAGYPSDLKHQVQLGMVGTIGRRLEKLRPPKIIFVDEAHHSVAGTWKAIIDANPDAYIVGLTATPERLDGRGLDDVFNALVPGPSVRWLMDEGFLSDYRAWSHDAPDLSEIRNRGADFDQKALADKMSDAHLVGDAVEHYLRICPGERGVSFCVNVEHALIVRDAFRAAGVTAEELDGSTPKEERKRVLRAFRDGDIDIITSVDLFGEGFDLPELSVVILQRPTQSLGLHLQQCGRVLRPVYRDGYDLSSRDGRLGAIANGSKPYAFILDHAGNLAKHGLPDADREWRLEGRKKGTRTSSGPAPKVCSKCFGSNPTGVEQCRYCGFIFILTPREIEQRDGELKEIEREQARSAKASESAMDCGSYEEIVAIFIARGHNDPATAAEAVWKRKGNAVSEKEYYDACRKVEVERNYKHGWAHFRTRMRKQRRAKVAA